MRRRLFLFVLSCVLLTGFLPAAAAADESDFVDEMILSGETDGELFYEATPAASIPDDACDSGFQTSIIDVADDVTVNDLNVGILATHPWRGDLYLVLLSPEGTEVTLYYDTTDTYGDSSDNLYGTFDAQSTGSPSNGYSDTVSDYDNRSFTTFDDGLTYVLNNFNGESSAGAWTFKYCDKGPGDIGTLVAWALFISWGTTTTTTTTTTSHTTTTTGHTTTTGYTTTTTHTSTSTTTSTEWHGDDDDDWHGDDEVGDDTQADDDTDDGSDDNGPGWNGGDDESSGASGGDDDDSGCGG